MTVDMTPKDDRPAVDPDVPGGDLIGDPPTGFYDGSGQGFPEPPMMDPGFTPMTEDEVEGFVDSLTSLLGWVLPKPPDAPGFWMADDRELGAIVPPATRIVNKRPRAIALMQRSDELVLAAQIGRYGLSRMRYLREIADDETDADPEGDIGLDGDPGPEPFPGGV